jgi:hypothetical protein
MVAFFMNVDKYTKLYTIIIPKVSFLNAADKRDR